MGAERKPLLSEVIRLWKIENVALQEIPKSKLDIEEKLGEWIARACHPALHNNFIAYLYVDNLRTGARYGRKM